MGRGRGWPSRPDGTEGTRKPEHTWQVYPEFHSHRYSPPLFIIDLLVIYGQYRIPMPIIIFTSTAPVYLRHQKINSLAPLNTCYNADGLVPHHPHLRVRGGKP